MPNKFWIIVAIVAFVAIITVFFLSILSYQSTIRTENQIDFLVEVLGDLQVEEVINE